MTRRQAADRLLRLSNVRAAKEACEMGRAALIDQPWVIAYSFLAGLLVGAVAMRGWW